MQDKVLKNRHPKGDDHYTRRRSAEARFTGTSNVNAVLNEDKVRLIRLAAGYGIALRLMARAFGTSQRTIQAVVRNETWRHIE